MIDQQLYQLTGRKVRLWLSSDDKGSFIVVHSRDQARALVEYLKGHNLAARTASPTGPVVCVELGKRVNIDLIQKLLDVIEFPPVQGAAQPGGKNAGRKRATTAKGKLPARPPRKTK